MVSFDSCKEGIIVSQALQLSNYHVSLYQLTMERSTPMEKMHRRGEIVSDQISVQIFISFMGTKCLLNKDLQRVKTLSFLPTYLVFSLVFQTDQLFLFGNTISIRYKHEPACSS